MANTHPIIADTKLTIVSRTATTISLRWKKATDKETPANRLMYTVTWCVAPYVWDNNVRKIGERKIDNDNYVITGLQPSTTYEIIVYVRDEDGCESMYASTVVQTLPKELPNTPPVISNGVVNFSAINSTTVMVSWYKATDKETAQDDLKYLVTWTPGPDYSVNNRKQSALLSGKTNKPTLPDRKPGLAGAFERWASKRQSYRITGLYPNVTYKVMVYAYDGKSYSAYQPLYVTTAPAQTGGGGGSTSADNTKSINSFLSSVPYSETALINNDLYDDKTLYPDAVESLPDRDAAFILSKKETNISNKEIYVRGNGYQNIYPGAILLVDTDITTGSPTPLSSVKRNKISIYGDFLAGSNTTQNDVEPNNSAVATAVNKIMETLLADSRYEAPGMQAPRTRIHSSEKSLMLDLSVDSSFAGVNVNVKAKTDSSEQTFIQATTLEQDYFTVKLKDTWRQDPSSLFDKSVTVEQLKKAMNGKAIAIVTSVTYGRTFSYLREYSAKKVKIDSSQKVSGYGTTASGSENYSSSDRYENDAIFNLGGSGMTISALRSKKTKAELEKAMADNMKFSRNNQGVVTKYTIQLVSGATPGKVVKPLFNGKQYQIGYIRCPRRLSAYINVSPVRVGGPGGGDVRTYLDVQCFRVVNGKPVIFKVINKNSSSKVQDPWYYTCNKTRTVIFGDLNAGEYIYKDPTIRIKSRASKVSKWTTDDSRILNHGEIETGDMELYLKGDVARAVTIKEIKSK